MSLGQYYKYNDISLNKIFASNSSDYNCTQYITNYKYNGTTIGPFNIGNGTWNQQADIPMKISLTSISSNYNLVAYYQEFTTSGDHSIPNISGCKQLKILLIGGGGSGGNGGGDDTGKTGTAGAGGGGGAIWLGTISYNSTTTYTVTVGSGGSSVSGGINGSTNYGNPGIDGGVTIIKTGGSATSYYANGGGGGGGGLKDGTATVGAGGANNTTGATYANAGGSSTNITGAKSAYSYNGIYLSYTQFPQLYGYTTYLYGNGGDGTPGAYDAPTYPTGAGNDGYARVYYIF